MSDPENRQAVVVLIDAPVHASAASARRAPN